MATKVLVAHGNTQQLRRVVNELQGAGFDVVATPDGGDAFARFFEVEPDVVLCSAVLPSLSGPNMARMVASQAPNVPVVILDDGLTEAVDEAIVLAEPFDMGAFRQAVPQLAPRVATAAAPARRPDSADVFVQAALKRFQRDNSLLSLLDDTGIRKVASVAQHQVRGDGELVIRQGDIGDGFYFIVEGQVRVTISDAPDPRTDPALGREVARINAGGFFGEMALLHDQPRSASIWTVGATTLLWFSRATFLPLLEEYPIIRDVLSGVASQRTEENLWRALFDDAEVQDSLDTIQDGDLELDSAAGGLAGAEQSAPGALLPPPTPKVLETVEPEAPSDLRSEAPISEAEPGVASGGRPVRITETVHAVKSVSVPEAETRWDPEPSSSAPVADLKASDEPDAADHDASAAPGAVAQDGALAEQRPAGDDDEPTGEHQLPPVTELSLAAQLEPEPEEEGRAPSAAYIDVRSAPFLQGLGAGIAAGLLIGITVTMMLVSGEPEAQPTAALPGTDEVAEPGLAGLPERDVPGVVVEYEVAAGEEGSPASEVDELAQVAAEQLAVDETGQPAGEASAASTPVVGAPDVSKAREAVTEEEIADRKRRRRSLFALYEEGRYGDAAQVGTHLLETWAVDWEAQFAVAQALRQAGQLDAAAATYRHFIATFPTNSFANNARFWIAEILSMRGEAAQARSLYERVAADPDGDHREEAQARLDDMAP